MSVTRYLPTPLRTAQDSTCNTVKFGGVVFVGSRSGVNTILPSRQLTIALLPALCALLLAARSAQSVPGPVGEVLLNNGMRVIVYERHVSPLVAIDVWMRAGSREEGPEEIGAAHFLEHTLFKGTATRRRGDVDTAMENLGATLNAATGPDFARFYTNVASRHARDAIAVMADVIRNATLPQDEIDRERSVILSELAQRDSDPAALLIDRLYDKSFPGGKYGHPPGGTAENIRARSRESLVAFYRRCYAPNRCVLVMAGDIGLDQARELAQSAFGDWKPRSAEAGAGAPGVTPAPLAAEPLPAGAAPARRTVSRADISRPIVGIAFKAPPAGDRAGAAAAQMVTALLGAGDVGGRLAVSTLAGSGARAYYLPREDACLLILTAEVPIAELPAGSSPQQTTDALLVREQALMAVLRDLAARLPGAAEVLNARNALIGRSTFDCETGTGLAFAIGYSAETRGAPLAEWRDEIQQIPVSAVRDFISHNLDPAAGETLLLLPRQGS